MSCSLFYIGREYATRPFYTVTSETHLTTVLFLHPYLDNSWEGLNKIEKSFEKNHQDEKEMLILCHSADLQYIGD